MLASLFLFGSFREIYTRYYERHKADVSCFFSIWKFWRIYILRRFIKNDPYPIRVCRCIV